MLKLHRFFSIITTLVMVLSFTLVPNMPAQGAVEPLAEPPDPLWENLQTFVLGPTGPIGPACFDCTVLEVTKTADEEFISPGDPMGFTVTVTNVGRHTAIDTRLEDELPAGVTWSVDHPGCSIKPWGWMYCEFGDLPVGESVSLHLSAMSTAEMCGVIKNQAVAYAKNAYNAYSNIAKITIVCSTNIAVTKEAEVSSISPGETARFIMTVRNTGTQIAQDVTLTDTLPVMEGLNWAIDSVSDGGQCTIANGVLNCSFGDLEPGAVRTVVISAQVPAGRCYEQIVNTVTVEAANELPASIEDNGDSATIYLNCTTLELYKEADATGVAPGTPIGFMIRVKNAGQSVATNVQVRDELEPLMQWSEDSQYCSIDANNVMTCNFGDLAPGQEMSVHITSVSSPDVCGTLDNTATATAGNFTQTVIATADIFIDCCSDLLITKRADVSFVFPGERARYFISVTNAGTGTVFEAVVNDPLPAADTLDWTVESVQGGGTCEINNQGTLVCNLGRMEPGITRTVTISAPVTEADCGQQLINTATVSGSNGPPEPLENNVSSETIALACSSFQVIKTANDNVVSLGRPVGFTITVINESGQTATGVQVTDTLDPRTTWSESSSFCTITNNELNCSFGSIPSGQSINVRVSGSSQPEMCGMVTNTVEAWAENFPTHLTSSASVTVDCEPNVAVTKSAVDPSVSMGQSAQFNITVINSGSAAAQNVVLSDSLPQTNRFAWEVGSVTGAGTCQITGGALSCDFGMLEPGDTRTVSVTAPVTNNNCGIVLSNTANVSASNESAVNSTDNSSSASITTACNTLQVSKIADTGVVGVNDPIGFTITVTNNGDVPASTVRLEDSVGTDTTWTADNEACSFNQGDMTCNFGELGPQSSATVHISGTATQVMCGPLTNIATAFSAGIVEPVSGFASVTIDCPADAQDVEIIKTAETSALFLGEATPLATARFNITVRSVGTETAQNVTLTDPLLDPISGDANHPNPDNLPELLTWAIDPTGDGADCNITNRELTCGFGNLAPGAERTVSISAVADYAEFSDAIVNQGLPMPQVFNNEATVSATGDTLIANNTSAADIQVFTSGQELVCYSPRLLYENNFNSGAQGEVTWSTNFHRTVSPGKAGHQPESFLGEYGRNDQVNLGLNLPGVTEAPTYNYLRIKFDLYIIRSWEGSVLTSGPDFWRLLLLNGTGLTEEILMNDTFTNWDETEEHRKTFFQSFPGMYPYFRNEPRTGAKARNTLGYKFGTADQDTIYGVTYYLERPETPTLNLGFSSELGQAIEDESWGIDNLKVEMCILNPQYTMRQKVYMPMMYDFIA